MKALYTLGDVFSAPNQMICYPINDKNISKTADQKRAKRMYPADTDLVDKVFTQLEQTATTRQDPMVGDIVWTKSSGSKWIAHFITSGPDQKINKDALRVIIQSIKNKCKQFNILEVGFPIVGSIPEWFGGVCEVVENTLGDVQPIVYCLTEEQMVEVLDTLEQSYKYKTAI